MNKVQITLTLESDQVDAIKAMSDDGYEGNMSMALRIYFKEHRLVERWLVKEE